MKVAFAVSVYNKLHELGLLVDVIRNQFGRDAYISVICNDFTKKEVMFSGFDIDALKIGANFHLYKDKAQLSYGDRILHLRIIDQVCEGFRRCAQSSDAEYIMHLHADALPLSSDGVHQVIHDMRQHDRSSAVRGYGFSFTPYFYNAGFIDDMFLFTDRRAVLERGVFDFDYGDLLLAVPEVHDVLLNMLRYRLGARKIHWYSTLQETLGWDDRPKRLHPFLPVCPLSYDPERRFLHVEGARFLDQDGMLFYSRYLVESGNTTGEHIQSHLQDYPYDAGLVERHAQKMHALFAGHAADERELYDDNPTDLVKRYLSPEPSEVLPEISNTLVRSSRWVEAHGPAASQHGWTQNPSMYSYIRNMILMEEVERQGNRGARYNGIFEFVPTENNLRNR